MNRTENLSRVFQKQKRKKNRLSFITQFQLTRLVFNTVYQLYNAWTCTNLNHPTMG